MDVLSVLRQNEAMLDLADRANKLAADRRRRLRSLRFHLSQEFGVALDSLLIAPYKPCDCGCEDER